jgi:ketosteroid isomerase-like protein
MSSTTRSDLLKAAHAYLQTYRAKDIAATTALQTPDCEHIVRPSSVSSSRNNDEHTAFHHQVYALLDSWDATITAETVDVETKTVVLWCDIRAKAEKVGTYESEYVFRWRFDEVGGEWKVSEDHGFIDSHAMMGWLERMGGGAREQYQSKEGEGFAG